MCGYRCGWDDRVAGDKACVSRTKTRRTKPAGKPAGFVIRATRLHAAHLDGVRAFLALRYLKGDLVPLTKVVEGNAYEFLGVEEDVLVGACVLDETETSVHQTRDSSFLHMKTMKLRE